MTEVHNEDLFYGFLSSVSGSKNKNCSYESEESLSNAGRLWSVILLLLACKRDSRGKASEFSESYEVWL